jgi:AmiR/NasT family two-component response regulator
LPTIALIGSESPGRLAWALDHRIDAFLPLTAISNIYSTLVISRALFERKVEQRRRDAETARRASQRLDVIRAVLTIMEENGLKEAAALKQLRAFSMVERMSLEDAAGLYLMENTARRKEGR